MQYILKRKLLVLKDTNEDLLISGLRDHVFKIEQNQDFYIKLLRLLKKESSIEDLTSKMRDMGFALEQHSLQKIIDDLLDQQIIEIHSKYNGTVLLESDLSKYDRQLHFMASMGMSMEDAYVAQEKLRLQHAAILGVGGVGGHTAYALAAMGLGELTIIDHDHIELSNTSRQVLYDETNIGRLKVDVAKEKLLNYNQHVKVNALNQHIQSEDDLENVLKDKKIDVLILAADTPRGEIQYIVDNVCQRLSIPFLIGSPSGNFVSIGPFIIPGKTKSLSQLRKKKYKLNDTEDMESINSGFVACIIEPYNAIAANLMALEIFKFFTRTEGLTSMNKIVILNLSTMSISTEKYND